jgi:hypothetical protein
MKVKRLSDNKEFEVQKYIKASDDEESVWCNEWYGRHVVGRHCEFVK